MTEKKSSASDNHLVAEQRENFGKGFARRLRAAGRVPAVIYGHGTEPQHVSLPAHQVGLILRKANQILELDVAGKALLALVKDVQKDPVRQIIEHLDLVIVKKGEKVSVEVPIHVVGESFSGTMVMMDLNTLRLEVEATHIPENVEINVEGLEEGAQIHVRDIALPTGAVSHDDPDALVVNIVVPSAQAEPEAAEGDAAEGTAEGESTDASDTASDDASAEADA